MGKAIRKYTVMIEGSNVYLNRGHIERMGFFTTRRIEAMNREEAERIALEHVKQELEMLDVLCNSPETPPVFSIEQVHEVSSFGDNIVPGKGFSFYKDELAQH